MTKVLANRLKIILPYPISKEQGGFFQGRQIVDGIIEMHEILHSTKNEGILDFFLKLDMQKAYDRVN